MFGDIQIFLCILCTKNSGLLPEGFLKDLEDLPVFVLRLLTV